VSGNDATNYASIPGVNWSSLRYMSVSPRMYRYRLTHPEPRKPVWTLGGAIHCAVLEPDAFDRRYVVLDAETIDILAPSRGTRAGKAIVAEHPERATSLMTSDEYQAACVAAAHPGKEALTEKQHATAIAARDAVHEHRVARDLLRGGLAEETITWTDGGTGLRLKSRLDYLRPDLVIDLKSTRDPSPSRFERDAVNYGIAAQVSMYQDGATAAKRVSGGERPIVVAVRAKDDFDVAVFQLTQEALDTGRTIYRSMLHRLAECTAANYFPGVAPEIRSLNLPPWAVTETINVPDEDF
jgi:hypothetical protein